MKTGVLLCATLGFCLLGLGGCWSAKPGVKETPQDLRVKPAVIASSASLGTEITLALSGEPKLKGSNISVSVSNLNGSVALIGNVKGSAQEKLALQIAERLAKKKAKDAKVVSQLSIQAPLQSAKPKSKTKSKSP